MLSQSAHLLGATTTTLRKLNAFELALIKSERARDLFAKLVALNPTDLDARAGLASATSSTGAIQSRLGKLDDARKSLADAVAQSEELMRLDPANIILQRSLMLAYSHLGDLLGNPGNPNLGDTTGAKSAYDAMVAVASKMYNGNPGDLGATINYGMALARSASITELPTAQRITLLGKGNELLGAALLKDPGNTTNRGYLASYKELMGDLLASSGQQPAAMELYRDGLQLFESQSPSAANSLKTFITTSRKLAEYLVKTGDSKQAVAVVERAQAFAEKAASSPKPNLIQIILLARSHIGAADVHAILGHTDETFRLRQKALEQYRSIENDPAFTAAYRTEMVSAEALLKADAVRR